MKRLAATLLTLVSAPMLASGCGFTPVYGSGALNAAAGRIEIPEIEGRIGHFLRQELVREVGPGLPGMTGTGSLDIKLSEAITRLGFKPDQAASRSDYLGSATFTLYDSNGKAVAAGQVSEAASFNFADAAYADIAAQSAAQERVASLMARSIREKLIISIGNVQAQATATPAPLATPLPTIPGTTTLRQSSEPK